jgi:hypothetical protein
MRNKEATASVVFIPLPLNIELCGRRWCLALAAPRQAGIIRQQRREGTASATPCHFADSAPNGACRTRAPSGAWLGGAWSIIVIWIWARFPVALNQRQQPQKEETPKASTEHNGQDGAHHSPPNSMKIAAHESARYPA